MESTRRGRDYQEDAAVAAAIAAVAAVAAADTNMMDSHAGELFSGGVGETDVQAVNDAINVEVNDFAATFDIDEEAVNIDVGKGDRDSGDIGDGDIGDGGGGGGRVITKKRKVSRKGKKLLSDAALLQYYETVLGTGFGCSCQGNCLGILEDAVICSESRTLKEG